MDIQGTVHRYVLRTSAGTRNRVPVAVPQRGPGPLVSPRHRRDIPARHFLMPSPRPKCLVARTSPRAAEPQDHGAERRVFAGSPGQSDIAACEKDEVIESAHPRHRARSPSIRNRTLPCASLHSAQAESRTIQNTTISGDERSFGDDSDTCGFNLDHLHIRVCARSDARASECPFLTRIIRVNKSARANDSRVTGIGLTWLAWQACNDRQDFAGRRGRSRPPSFHRCLDAHNNCRTTAPNRLYVLDLF